MGRENMSGGECIKNESVQTGTVFYGDAYPTRDEWQANFINTIAHYGGNLELGSTCLPAETLSNDFIKIFNTIGSGLLLFAMGLATNFDELKKVATSPALLIIGQLLQYILMPIIAIAFIYIFKLVYIEALATFLYGVSPGGGFSNFIAFYTDSNLELSVALSTISNVFAFAMMPLWLLLWPSIEPDNFG